MNSEQEIILGKVTIPCIDLYFIVMAVQEFCTSSFYLCIVKTKIRRNDYEQEHQLHREFRRPNLCYA